MVFPISYLGNRRQAMTVIRRHPSLLYAYRPQADRPPGAWHAVRRTLAGASNRTAQPIE